MTQLNLFGELPERPRPVNRNGVPSLDKFEGALLCSTVGDALGWPTEFLKPVNGHQPPFHLPVKDFVSWKKLVGGKWWGYNASDNKNSSQQNLEPHCPVIYTSHFKQRRYMIISKYNPHKKKSRVSFTTIPFAPTQAETSIMT